MTDKNKVIVFTLDYFHIGGATTFVEDYIRYLTCSGYKIVVLGEKGNIINSKKYFKNHFTNCKMIFLPKSRWSGQNNIIQSFLFKLFLMKQFALEFEKVRRQYSVQAIHLNLTWSALGILLLCPVVYKIPRVITFYNDSGAEFAEKSNLPKDVLRRLKFNAHIYLLYFLQKLSLQLSSRIITFSDYARDLVLNKFGIQKNKVTVIPGAIFFDELQIQNIKNFALIKKRSTFRIVNISRFERRKGHAILLKAARYLLDRDYDIELLISGPLTNEDIDPILSLYENLQLFDRVRFLHFSDISQKYMLLKSSDLFVMPSTSLETFGMTIIEALSVGVPVIGFPTGAIPEILRNIDSSLITKKSDYISLAKKIEWYINLDEQKKKHLRKRCKYVAKQKYSADIVLRPLDKLYEKFG